MCTEFPFAGLDPLPVQIRQAKDPLLIISRVIKEAPSMAYKQDDLLRLGRLLGTSACVRVWCCFA